MKNNLELLRPYSKNIIMILPVGTSPLCILFPQQRKPVVKKQSSIYWIRNVIYLASVYIWKGVYMIHDRGMRDTIPGTYTGYTSGSTRPV